MASSREELLSDLEKNSRLDGNFLILVFLSTLVAAVGLVAGTAVAVWQAEQARRQADLATAEAQKATAIGDFLAGSPPSSSDNAKQDPGPVAAVAGGKRAAECFGGGSARIGFQRVGCPCCPCLIVPACKVGNFNYL